MSSNLAQVVREVNKWWKAPEKKVFQTRSNRESGPISGVSRKSCLKSFLDLSSSAFRSRKGEKTIGGRTSTTITKARTLDLPVLLSNDHVLEDGLPFLEIHQFQPRVVLEFPQELVKSGLEADGVRFEAIRDELLKSLPRSLQLLQPFSLFLLDPVLAVLLKEKLSLPHRRNIGKSRVIREFWQLQLPGGERRDLFLPQQSQKMGLSLSTRGEAPEDLLLRPAPKPLRWPLAGVLPDTLPVLSITLLLMGFLGLCRSLYKLTLLLGELSF